MTQPELETLLHETRENFKIAIDDLFNVIEILKDDVNKLKIDKKIT